MNADEWIREAAENTRLSERRAAALYYRQHGVGRGEAADRMDTTPSNVDNAESEARREIVRSINLLALAREIGIDADQPPAIGVCAECDEPTPTLVPHSDDVQERHADLEDARMICPSCSSYDVASSGD